MRLLLAAGLLLVSVSIAMAVLVLKRKVRGTLGEMLTLLSVLMYTVGVSAIGAGSVHSPVSTPYANYTSTSVTVV